MSWHQTFVGLRVKGKGLDPERDREWVADALGAVQGDFWASPLLAHYTGGLDFWLYTPEPLDLDGHEARFLDRLRATGIPEGCWELRVLLSVEDLGAPAGERFYFKRFPP